MKAINKSSYKRGRVGGSGLYAWQMRHRTRPACPPTAIAQASSQWTHAAKHLWHNGADQNVGFLGRDGWLSRGNKGQLNYVCPFLILSKEVTLSFGGKFEELCKETGYLGKIFLMKIRGLYRSCIFQLTGLRYAKVL